MFTFNFVLAVSSARFAIFGSFTFCREPRKGLSFSSVSICYGIKNIDFVM